MAEPLVTVVVITYEHERLVSDCLRSLVAQTYRNLEILVCDDASGDQTVAVAKTFANNDERIRIVCAEKNGGVSRNLNRGLGEAKGEFIAIIAGDDGSMPTRIARQVEAMQADPDCALCYTDWFIAVDDLDNIAKLSSSNGRYRPQGTGMDAVLMAKGNFVGGPTGMVRRSLTEDLRFDPRIDMCSDRLFWAQCARRGTVRYIDRPLCIYRRHSESLTARRPGRAKRAYEAHQQMFDIAEHELGFAPDSIKQGRALARWRMLKDHLRYRAFPEALHQIRSLSRHPRSFVRAAAWDRAQRLG